MNTRFTMIGWGIFFLLLLGIAVTAEQTAPMVIRNTEIVSGVVIITADFGGKSIELQCNEGNGFCRPLKKGNYIAIELPKNHGMYDCRNVDVYAQDADPGSTDKLGEYCLIQR